MSTLDQLRSDLALFASKLAAFRERRIHEQATKQALITPLLKSLGWDVHDPEVVCLEWQPARSQGGGNPVDYALVPNADGQPLVLVEAKRLGERLDRHASQAAAYAQQVGVPWCVLTDGHEWRVYRVGGFRPLAPLRDWLVWHASIDQTDAVSEFVLIDRQALCDGSFEAGVRRRFEAQLLEAALVAMWSQPPAPVLDWLSERTGLNHQRVLELWPAVPDRQQLVDRQAATPVAVTETDGDVLPVADQISLTAQPFAAPQTAESANWLPGGQRPPVGTKPLEIHVLGSTRQVRSWADLLYQVAEQVAKAHPTAFARALDAEQFEGRKSRKVGRSDASMRKAAAVSGGFVETNLSAGDCVGLANALLLLCPSSSHAWSYRLRAAADGEGTDPER